MHLDFFSSKIPGTYLLFDMAQVFPDQFEGFIDPEDRFVEIRKQRSSAFLCFFPVTYINKTLNQYVFLPMGACATVLRMGILSPLAAMSVQFNIMERSIQIGNRAFAAVSRADKIVANFSNKVFLFGIQQGLGVIVGIDDCMGFRVDNQNAGLDPVKNHFENIVSRGVL